MWKKVWWTGVATMLQCILMQYYLDCLFAFQQTLPLHSTLQNHKFWLATFHLYDNTQFLMHTKVCPYKPNRLYIYEPSSVHLKLYSYSSLSFIKESWFKSFAIIMGCLVVSQARLCTTGSLLIRDDKGLW